jgi:hypothetical protein
MRFLKFKTVIRATAHLIHRHVSNLIICIIIRISVMILNVGMRVLSLQGLKRMK